MNDIDGMHDQIVPGTGVLLSDPTNLEAASHEILRLLNDKERRVALGSAAHDHVRANFVGDLHVARFAELLNDLATEQVPVAKPDTRRFKELPPAVDSADSRHR